MSMRHPWNISVEEAHRHQEELKKHVIIHDAVKNPKTIGGVDISYNKIPGKPACCVICLFSYPDLEILSHAYSIGEIVFPYIPSLFAFREGPLIEQTFSLLSIKPDILLFDGHGICHPSGIGIASHLGVYLDISTIGCAKNKFAGTFSEPGPLRGSKSPILIGNILVGYTLRTKDKAKPVFVSPGHKVSLRSSVDICMQCTGRFRIPEPIRCSHIQSRTILRQDLTA
jgi:deoxyribonuclease V